MLVSVAMAFICKRPPTLAALEWLLTRVRAHVSIERGLTVKVFSTNVADLVIHPHMNIPIFLLFLTLATIQKREHNVM